jgi:glycerol transport system ATP-binding protein
LENGRNLPALGVLSRLPDGAYRLGFRAESVVIGEARPSSLSFPGEVAVTEISGTESFVHVDVGLGVWVALTEGVHDWQPGAKVDVRVDSERAFVFDAAGKLAATPTIAKTG